MQLWCFLHLWKQSWCSMHLSHLQNPPCLPSGAPPHNFQVGLHDLHRPQLCFQISESQSLRPCGEHMKVRMGCHHWGSHKGSMTCYFGKHHSSYRPYDGDSRTQTPNRWRCSRRVFQSVLACTTSRGLTGPYLCTIDIMLWLLPCT